MNLILLKTKKSFGPFSFALHGSSEQNVIALIDLHSLKMCQKDIFYPKQLCGTQLHLAFITITE